MPEKYRKIIPKGRKNIEKSEPWDLFPGAYVRQKSLKNHITNSTKNQCLKSIET